MGRAEHGGASLLPSESTPTSRRILYGPNLGHRQPTYIHARAHPNPSLLLTRLLQIQREIDVVIYTATS